MSAQCLQAKPVERTWGRVGLPTGFEPFERGEPIGEIWHNPAAGDAAELLVKHLFSAERLSVQVHPDDARAAERGLARGKDEAWYILDAEPGAAVALGLRHEATGEELRAAALSGSIETLVDWRPVSAGDFLFAPAGTIHAIGGGISLIEIQQNSDVTYRLYDYGRPRELHLDEGLAVARRGPWTEQAKPQQLAKDRTLMLAGPTFVVERWAVDGAKRLEETKTVLAIPVGGRGAIDGHEVAPGQVLSIGGQVELRGEGLSLLIAYPGSEVMDLAL